ncbi:metallophosphoesterase family protein [Tateyamaria sp. ANG-S1]|uniref:metallophosphoesterase family protein n=1 Tax=Tateyamaria sp. ANG-S1 TaxID=1577905 RepID=UPI00057E90B8|nr:metallophosphoesterase family protein [Tateyamaria sp. ANG-S1]KIC48982.1 diadenosine tetraphosphatase [Tateyamaria sp. ANG-S1]
MRVQDLGVMDGPVLLFGGPYSNLQATRAVLGQAEHLGADPICTGDVVAYCARPAETVDAIRQAGCPVVAGNCEIQLAAGAADCGCGFEEGSACDLLSVGWYGFAQARIDDGARGWMASLPDVIVFTHAGARYATIHGGVSDVSRFLWSTSPDAAFRAEWAALEARVGPVDHVIAGHSGIPFQREIGVGRWINAGVVGMPPHDGSTETAYVILRQGVPTFHRLRYDVDGAVADMEAAGLTYGYDRALRSGYWPSEDVLPPDLRLSLASG